MIRPIDWPVGLGLAANPGVLNGLKFRIYKKPHRAFESVAINPKNYKVQRVMALKRLADMYGFDKVPAGWGRKVTSDFDKLCKDYGVTYKEVTAYVFTEV